MANNRKSAPHPKGKSGPSAALEIPAIDRMVNSAAQDIGSFIRAQREAAEVSLRQLAERTGVSNPYLSQIERGLRKPSAEVLAQIAKGLRISAEVLYTQAGILEESRTNSVRDAVLTAPELTERQRNVLVDIYDSFVANNAAQLNTNAAQLPAGKSATPSDDVEAASPMAANKADKPAADAATVRNATTASSKRNAENRDAAAQPTKKRRTA